MLYKRFLKKKIGNSISTLGMLYVQSISEHQSVYELLRFYDFLFKGHIRLVNAISKLYSKHFKHEIDPLTQVLITIGAYGSLHNAITSLLNKDDEVIIKTRKIKILL
jgi:aspartate/methionine/tyrosine aminotransferase